MRGNNKIRWFFVGAIAIFWLPALFLPTTVGTPAWFLSEQARQTTGSTLVLPYAYPSIYEQPLIWQAQSQFVFKMPEGVSKMGAKSSFGSLRAKFIIELLSITTYGRVQPSLSTSKKSDLKWLQQHKVTRIVVGPENNEKTMITFINKLTKVKGHYILGIWLWRL